MKKEITKKEYNHLKNLFATIEPLKLALDTAVEISEDILEEPHTGASWVFDYLYNSSDKHNLNSFLKKYKIKVLK